MKKVGHIIFAVILNFLFIYLTIYLGFSWFDVNLKNIALVTLIIIFYSILPDIDHKNSSITWWFFGLGLVVLILGIALMFFKVTRPDPLIVIIGAAAFLVITFISSNFLKHRGLVHTVQAGIIAAFPTYFLFHHLLYPALAYLAWHSHLLGDGFLFKIR